MDYYYIYEKKMKKLIEFKKHLISKNIDVFMIGMGSGLGCDAQYLFAEDISVQDQLDKQNQIINEQNKRIEELEKIIQTLIVKDESGQASSATSVIINPAGSQTIDGAPAVYLESPYGSVFLYTDGSDWFIY